MASKAIDTKSKFNIYSSFSLSADDVHSLSLLYAPLIGSDAFLLYMGFSSLLERSLGSEEITHQDFFDIYSFTPSSFLKARYKLEGIGLLQTFINSEGNYSYMLSTPLSAKNFVKDTPFGVYLKSKISDEIFELILKQFKLEKFEKKDYQNITRSFDEVFDSDVNNNETMERFDYLLGRNLNDNLQVRNIHFDMDEFLREINPELLEVGITEQFKKDILNRAYVFAFDANEMVNLFNESINRKGVFDLKIFDKKLLVYFQVIRNRKAPKLVANENKANVTQYKDMIEYLDTVSPSALLDKISPDYPINYLNTITQVYSEIDLPRGVLNAMIMKVARDKSGEIPPIAYFKKVAESWIRDNVLSTADAIRYITELKTVKTEKTYSSEAARDAAKNEDNGGFEVA